MPTYLDLRTRIARDLWRAPSATDCPFDPDIKGAVESAVRAHQWRPFWFSEQDWKTNIPTVAGQAYYPVPEDMATIRNVRVFDGARWRAMTPLPEAEIDDVAARFSPARPEFYCVINRQFRVAPTPSGAFAMNMTGTRIILAPVNDGESNEWTNEAFDLIVWEAEALLQAGFKKDAAQAAVCAQFADAALRTLMERTARFKPVPDISPDPRMTPC